MNVLTCFFRNSGVAVVVIAIGMLLTPQRVMAQGAALGLQTAPGFITSGPVTGQDTGGVAGNVAGGFGATSAASGGFGTAIGASSVASGAEGPTAFGAHAIASGDDAVALGGGGATGPHATSGGSISVGAVSTSTNFGSVSIGTGSSATGVGAVAIGGGDSGAFSVNSAHATADEAVAIGHNSQASATDATAIGVNSSAGFTNSTAIGAGAATSSSNQMAFGTGTNTYTMPGINSAASAAAQVGQRGLVTTDAFGNLAAASNPFPDFKRQIRDLAHEERAGTALAIATSQIRYDDRPGKWSFGIAGAGFIDEAGGAVGVGYTTLSQRMRLNVSGGGTSHHDVGIGAGVGFTFN
jgi:trimeric autotransporter adhesin